MRLRRLASRLLATRANSGKRSSGARAKPLLPVPRGPFRRAGAYAVVAAAALTVGFGAATQLRSQLVTPYNRVERNAALVRNVRDLERTNAAERARIAALRRDIAGLEAEAARRSETTQQLEREVADLRAHAGTTPMHGPGVTVEVANGRASADDATQTGHLVSYQDVQDVVNLLFAAGAEGIAVDGRRITPMSGYRGAGGAVAIDQGPPVESPLRIAAVGNRAEMEQALGDASTLGDLRQRQRRFGLRFSWNGASELSLPAFDGSLDVGNARPY
jgi:uncharacterized protein YlxW (UPF0749 family)